MKLDIAALTSTKAAIGLKPEIGVESHVYVARGELVPVGELEMDSPTSAVADFYSNADLGTGMDLHIRAENPVEGVDGGTITVTLDVTLEGAVVDTATATFDIPGWSSYQKNYIPIGLSADFVPDTPANAGLKVVSVQGLDSVSDGALGNQFKIYATPPIADFIEIGCTRSKSGQFKLPTVVNIACGYDSAAHTKLGRSDEQNLTLSFAYASQLEALSRFNGHRCLVLIKVVKDNAVHWENILYSGYIPRANADRGDGNDEVVATSESSYEKFMVGYAR